MTFQLTVLGGSAAWPNPGQGCSSYLLEAGGYRLLLDCGTDTLLELRRHTDLNDIDAIVISHCHSDHILDLIAFRYALVYSNEQVKDRIPVWMPPGGIDVLMALGDALGSQGERTTDFWGDVFVLQEYDPVSRLQIDSLGLDFARTRHFVECYAIRVTAQSGTSIVYGADTGSIHELIDFARNAGILIAEATADSHDGVAPEDRGHIIPEDAGEWANEAAVERLLLTHLWHERPPVEVVRRAATRYGGPIDVASPGLTLYV